MFRNLFLFREQDKPLRVQTKSIEMSHHKVARHQLVVVVVRHDPRTETVQSLPNQSGHKYRRHSHRVFFYHRCYQRQLILVSIANRPSSYIIFLILWHSGPLSSWQNLRSAHFIIFFFAHQIKHASLWSVGWCWELVSGRESFQPPFIIRSASGAGRKIAKIYFKFRFKAFVPLMCNFIFPFTIK